MFVTVVATIVFRTIFLRNQPVRRGVKKVAQKSLERENLTIKKTLPKNSVRKLKKISGANLTCRTQI